MISANLALVKSTLPNQVSLIAVSKTFPNDAVLEAYNAGQRIFGENRVQELTEKYEALPKDIEWHLIGHLQTNKVKYIAPFVAMIHAVDSAKLLEEINKQGVKNNRRINCLLQFHIAREETKFGFSFEEAVAMLESTAFRSWDNVRICGVMGMATHTSDEAQVLAEFETLNNYFEQLKARFFTNDAEFKERSMGMSSDYPLAIKAGSTMVRIGSAIFGTR